VEAPQGWSESAFHFWLPVIPGRHEGFPVGPVLRHCPDQCRAVGVGKQPVTKLGGPSMKLVGHGAPHLRRSWHNIYIYPRGRDTARLLEYKPVLCTAQPTLIRSTAHDYQQTRPAPARLSGPCRRSNQNLPPPGRRHRMGRAARRGSSAKARTVSQSPHRPESLARCVLCQWAPPSKIRALNRRFFASGCHQDASVDGSIGQSTPRPAPSPFGAPTNLTP